MIFVPDVVDSDAMNEGSFVTLQEPYFLYSTLIASCFTGRREYFSAGFFSLKAKSRNKQLIFHPTFEMLKNKLLKKWTKDEKLI
jgi:hypothetical protein